MIRYKYKGIMISQPTTHFTVYQGAYCGIKYIYSLQLFSYRHSKGLFYCSTPQLVA